MLWWNLLNKMQWWPNPTTCLVQSTDSRQKSDKFLAFYQNTSLCKASKTRKIKYCFWYLKADFLALEEWAEFLPNLPFNFVIILIILNFNLVHLTLVAHYYFYILYTYFLKYVIVTKLYGNSHLICLISLFDLLYLSSYDENVVSIISFKVFRQKKLVVLKEPEILFYFGFVQSFGHFKWISTKIIWIRKHISWENFAQ